MTTGVAAIMLLACSLSIATPARAQGGKRIVVSIGDQRVYYLEDENLVKSDVCSTGMDDYPTPVGVFAVYSHQYEYHNARSIQYYNMFYSGHLAFHSILYDPSNGSWIGGDQLGQRVSHGCIRQTLEDASWAYSWAPDGTRVDMIREHFEPPPQGLTVNGASCAVGATTPATRLYFAEGTCRPGFETYLCVLNPGKVSSDVRVTYFKGDGTTALQSVSVPPGSRITLRAKDTLGEADDPAHDFGCMVESVNGQPVVAERPVYFKRGGVDGGHTMEGTPDTSRVFYFAEGSCRPGFDTFLCILNPGGGTANVRVSYYGGGGGVAAQSLVIRPGRRKTIRVKDVLGEGDDPAHDFSCKVESTGGQGIVCERPTYFTYKGMWNGGHDVLGATAPASRQYFAEGTCRPGFEPYICMFNPGTADAEVKVRFMKGDGTQTERIVECRGQTRSTLFVPDVLGVGDDAGHDFSCTVESPTSGTLICERPQYFTLAGRLPFPCDGGTDVMGASGTSGTFYFAEGTCRPGFEPYLSILNPEESATTVLVRFDTGTGDSRTRAVHVGGRSRATVAVSDSLGEADGPGGDFSCSVKTVGGVRVLCERVIYFNHRFLP